MTQYTTVQSILFNFSSLFLLCKIFGIYPHNLQIFQQYRELRKSSIGTICVLLSLIVVTILYNLLIFSFSEEDNSLKTSQSTLTFVIGIFLTYIGLAMMVTDQLTAIRNQKHLGQLYDRIRLVDERLLHEGCYIDNKSLSKRITIMIVLVFSFELAITLLSFIILTKYTQWRAFLWIFSCFPTLYNSLDKIWFAGTLYALQQRFVAINNTLNRMVDEHEQYKAFSSKYANSGNKKVNLITEFLKESQEKENLNFIYEELSGALETKTVRYKKGKNQITPVTAVATTSLNNFKRLPINKKNNSEMIIHESHLNNPIKVEETLNNFCQIHDELCEIGKMLNELWSYPILMLMAYGFLIFTAQLYFLYCATQGQDILSLFLSAKNAFITAIFLTYTAGKCVYLIYLSWKTSIESKGTGIYLHKCGVVVDNSDFYETINHLSLKLLNHTVDFTACGFFSLNMETLYGISGGITSYLIILIQFNLAAQQAKEGSNSHDKNQTSVKDLEKHH